MSGNRKFRTVLACLLLGTTAAALAQPKSKTTSRSVRPDQVRLLSERIASLPVEFRADLTFAALHDIPEAFSPTTRQRMLVDLFLAAPQAHYPSAILDGSFHNMSVQSQMALNLSISHLDTLDIQVRAVSMVRERSESTAWDMAQKIILPRHNSDCSDYGVADMRSYYKLLRVLINGQDAKAWRGAHSRELYVLNLIDSVSDVAALLALTKSLGGLDIDQSEMATILAKLAAKFAEMSASDREMSGVEAEGLLTDAIGALARRARSKKLDPMSLINQYGVFLRNNLRGKACSDYSLDRDNEVRRYNSLVKEFSADPDHLGTYLSVSEIKPNGLGGSARYELISMPDSIKQQMAAIAQVFIANQQLRYGSGDNLHMIQPEPQDVSDVLSALRGMSNAETNSALVNFENKQSILTNLIEMLPEGPSFREVVDQQMFFLNLNPVEEDNPPAWLRPFKQLIAISRHSDPSSDAVLRSEAAKGEGQIMLPSRESTYIRATLARYSGDQIISTYVAYERIVKPPYVPFRATSVEPD